MRMRQIGLLALAIGFVLGAFATTQQLATIDWRVYGAAMASALVGLVLTRLGTKAAASGDSQLAADVDVVDKGLDSLVEKLAGLSEERETLNVYDVHDRIDSTLRDDLDDVVDSRMSLAQRYGLQEYANLMTRFATAERYINRAWSASADGYVDEVWKCVDLAEQQMKRAQTLMKQYLAS